VSKDTTVQIFYPNFLTVFEEALIQSQLIFYACVTGQSLSFILQAGVLKKWQLKKEAKLLQRDKSLMSRKTMPGFFVFLIFPTFSFLDIFFSMD